jgi:hypothetical protein
MSWFADLVSAPYNAVTGQLTQWQKDSLTADEQAQIQTVSDNAAQYYGADSDTALIADRTAQAQADNAVGDVNTIAKLASTDKGGCPGGLNLNGIGLGCVSSFDDFLAKINTLTKWGLLAVGVLILGWAVVTVGPTVIVAAKRVSK